MSDFTCSLEQLCVDGTERLSLHSNNQREWWLVLGSVSGCDGKWSNIVYILKKERKIFADATNVDCGSKKNNLLMEKISVSV